MSQTLSSDCGRNTSGAASFPTDDLVGGAVSLLALASFHGMGYWTLRNLRKSGSGFKQILRADLADELHATLSAAKACVPRKALDDWPEIHSQLWSKANEQYHGLRRQSVEVILAASDFLDCWGEIASACADQEGRYRQRYYAVAKEQREKAEAALRALKKHRALKGCQREECERPLTPLIGLAEPTSGPSSKVVQEQIFHPSATGQSISQLCFIGRRGR